MTAQPTDRRDLSLTHDDEAKRRQAVKQRARELKVALLESTSRLSPERSAMAYNRAAGTARVARLQRLPALRLCLAVLGGALSTLVPFSHTCELQGQLTMAEASQPDTSHGTTFDRRALVYAQLRQCASLSLDEPAAVFVHHEGGQPGYVRGQVMQIAPRAGTGEAPCQITLRLLAEHRELPATAALTAVVALQPRSWMGALADKVGREDSLHVASHALAGVVEGAARRSVKVVELLRNDQDLRRHWETLRQIFASDEP